MKKIVLLLMIFVVGWVIYNRFSTEKKIIKSDIKLIQPQARKPDQITVSTLKERSKALLEDKTIEELEDIFSHSDIGRGIIKVITLYDHMDNPTSKEGKEASEQIKELLASPNETYKEIKERIRFLPPKYETRKQFLIQLVGNLDIDKGKKLEFLVQELKNIVVTQKESTNIQVSYTPSIIFNTFIRVSKDPEAIEKLLIDILPESSLEVRKTLLSSFNTIDPEKTDKLIMEFVTPF